MAEWLSSWITSIICAAAFCAVSISLTPKGRMQKAVKLICGIVMILSVIKPVSNIDFSEYSRLMTKYNDNAAEFIDNANNYEDKLNRLYIQDECAAYILDKAEKSGAELNSVAVNAEWSTEGYWYPVSAEISYKCSDEQKHRLEMAIEAELGITKERQAWTCGTD